MKEKTFCAGHDSLTHSLLLIRILAGNITVAFALEGLGAQSGEQSGDLQGLSNVQGADSESVDELLEEGNAFEAEVVKGVEDAGDTDEGKVRTHEVPQDVSTLWLFP
jgi:hypothetical protein